MVYPFKNMLNRIVEKFLPQKPQELSWRILSNQKHLENLLVLQGRVLALQNAERAPLQTVQHAEFKVFSQFGEDGILQYLIRECNITEQEKTFIEFGVQDYCESNTRFLLMNDCWRGFIIDGSKSYIDTVRKDDIYWRHDLTAVDAWVDRDNINGLLDNSGFSEDLGILSIDIDGNDYWVWESINVVRPVIVVIEWNSVYGSKFPISVPYDSSFQRHEVHYSCLHWGASIQALNYLANKKGYALVCSNSAGNNLFFVRRDRLGRIKPLSPEKAYVASTFRDSRDENGELNFLSGERRRIEIMDLPVVDVTTGTITTIRGLDSI